MSADDIAKVDAEWLKWRAEWVRRKKVFNMLDLLGHAGSNSPQLIDVVHQLGSGTL